MAKKQSQDGRVLEHGDIFFFYRPKVGVEMARNLEDVADFHIILHPLKTNLYRFAAVSLMGLLSGNLEAWEAKLEVVETYLARVMKKLKEAHPIPAARACGEGIYAIAEHRGHTHLAYALELPQDPGEVQRALGIFKRANPILSVKNPLLEAAAGLESPQVVLPAYPPDLLALFGDARMIPAKPVKLLDYEGAELFIAETEHFVPSILDIDLMPEHENEKTAEVYEMLRLRREEIPMEPLFEGHWV